MDHFDKFYSRLCEYAGAILTPRDFEPSILIDAVVEGSDITFDLLDEWDQFYPHGECNPQPRLVTRDVRVGRKRRIGKDLTHLKFSVDALRATSRPWYAECIGWGMAPEWDDRLESGDRVDVAYIPSINRYQGRRSLQLIIQDMKLSANGADAGMSEIAQLSPDA
jgi:single-stranded-DNA-specific exonuclease